MAACVLGMAQDNSYRTVFPDSAISTPDSSPIQFTHDVKHTVLLLNEKPIYFTDHLNFLLCARYQNNAISCYAFVLPVPELLFGLTFPGQQKSAKPVAS